jgi:hypothetical protein
VYRENGFNLARKNVFPFNLEVMFIGCRCTYAYWAGELVCGCRSRQGMRKLRPRVELHSLWEKARALATEQKRNVHLAREDEAC